MTPDSRARAAGSRGRPALPRVWLALLPLLAGAALRFYALGDLPHGIYHDEAFYGLDALSVAGGAHPIFFTANNGREPFYIYVLSLSVAAFGRTPFGLRFAAALIGTLTIAAAYRLGRALLDGRAGLLAMWVCAGAFWPLALSRISFRAGALPLLLGLAIGWGWQAWQRKSIRLALLSGAAYGLAFNTYTASRVTPLALILFALLQIRRRGGLAAPGSPRPAAKTAAAFLIATTVVVAPLGLYALANPAQVFAREGQVSIFETESGDPVLILAKHVGLAAAMFNFQGDRIPRHNLPGRPVFDAALSLFFVLGLLVCLARLWAGRRAGPEAFVLIWLAVAALPTVLAEDTPHYLRSIAMLPVLWLIPAVGLDVFVRHPRLAFLPGTIRSLAVAGVIVLSTGLTAYDYFVRYVHLSVTDYYFESAATDLAAEINSRPGFSNRIDDRLWDNFASLRFLIPDRAGVAASPEVQLAVWPYETSAVRQAVAELPARSQISARIGALARGDLESTPYSLYTLYIARPAAAEPLLARFGDSLELRGVTMVARAGQVSVRLGWSVSRPVDIDYHVYVHVQTGGDITAQWDGEPLQNQYHFTWLKPGNVLDDEYVLLDGEHVVVGVYTPDGGALGEPVSLK